METIGILGFVCSLICMSKIEKLEHKIKCKNNKNRRDKKGDNMLKLISELIGKRCLIYVSDESGMFGGAALGYENKVECDIIDADDEWIKINYEDKKKINKTKLVRIENIEGVELV